jgi:hypothetical protein
VRIAAAVWFPPEATHCPCLPRLRREQKWSTSQIHGTARGCVTNGDASCSARHRSADVYRIAGTDTQTCWRGRPVRRPVLPRPPIATPPEARRCPADCRGRRGRQGHGRAACSRATSSRLRRGDFNDPRRRLSVSHASLTGGRLWAAVRLCARAPSPTRSPLTQSPYFREARPHGKHPDGARALAIPHPPCVVELSRSQRNSVPYGSAFRQSV